jgi:PAS domain S-box-containing protein
MDLSAARDLPSVMATVRRAVRDLTGADGATFVLREGDLCHYADEDAIGPLWKGKRFPAETCVSGWAMTHKQAAVVEDVYADARIPLSAYEPTFIRSLLMVPIRASDPLGAIGAYWSARHRATEDEVRLVQSLADSTAVSMENVRALDEARRWRALLAEASDTIWMLDSGTGTGEMDGVGRWWASLTGRPASAYGDPNAWIEDLHPEDQPPVAAAWARSLRGPVPFRMAYRVRAHDGRLRYLEARAVPVVRPGGTHEMVGMVTDRTREREAEQEAESLLDRERLARQASDQILERVSDGFVAMDREARYTYVNKRAGELLGRAPEDLLGQHVWTLFPEARGGPVHLAMERALATQQVVCEEQFFPPWRRWFENRIFPSTTGWSVFFTDVTERRLTQEVLEETRLRAQREQERLLGEVAAEKRRLERLAECVPAGIVMVTAPSGHVTFSNRRATEILEGSLEGLGATLARRGDHVGEDGPSDVIARVFDTDAPVLDREIVCFTREGRPTRLLASAVPVVDDQGHLEAVVASFHDVTHAHAVREELRQLSRSLLTAQDEERRRISRDLHDDLAQVLTAVKMSLAGLAPGVATPAFDASVRHAIEIVDRSIRQARDLSLQLHPPMLDVLGLVPTLRWHLSERLPGPVPAATLAVLVDRERFAPEIENACFRVVQEAVTNVLRHSRARRVRVELREEPEALVLAVEDDGCGFVPATTRARAAAEKFAGLAGMQERVALAGGAFDLRSQPGGGTRVGVRFPLEANR